MAKYNYCITPPEDIGFIDILKELQFYKIPIYLTDPKQDKIYCTLAYPEWETLISMGCLPEYDLIHGPKETRHEPDET